MIELSASSENAFKLYNFLNKGERKHIKVNDKIKEKYLHFDETMFRNIKPDEQWIIINENGYNTKYYIFIEKS